jgi:hypothetical protein
MLIQENIAASSTLLDFPTRERFVEELKPTHMTLSASRASLSTWVKCARCAVLCGCTPQSRRS